MTTIGLFYGSTAGTTEDAARLIQQEFERAGHQVDVHDVGTTDIEAMVDYDKLIIGVPTYNIGELQDDWYMVFDELADLVLIGVQVALFGLGDQYGYADTFQDALGILGRRLRDDCGANLLGFWPSEGYDFNYSAGVEDGLFMGLALDDDHQAALTESRIKAWVQQLVREFELADAVEVG